MSIHKTAATAVNAREHGLALLRQMLLIRRFEEKAAELNTKGKVCGFLDLYFGALFLAAVDRLLQQPEAL